MTEITPGPWTQHDRDYCPLEIFGNLDIADGEVKGTQICEVLTNRVDARLIAAAPEMLEALKAALAAMTNQRYLEPRRDMEKEHAIVRNAIRKALDCEIVSGCLVVER